MCKVMEYLQENVEPVHSSTIRVFALLLCITFTAACVVHGSVSERLHVVQLLLQYSVDIAVSGHTHVTQRHCATKNFTCVANSTLAIDGVHEYVAPPAPIFYNLGNAGANSDNSVCCSNY